MPTDQRGTALAEMLYDTIGAGYANLRRPDPRIAAAIWDALGDARSVINVGAGTGSYEPPDRDVLAVEPSEVMISQRPSGTARCLRGVAEALPVPDASFDAAMAILTIHHWRDWRQGLRELRRATRRRMVILTFDPEESQFWLTAEYFPEFLALDREIMPPLREVTAALAPAAVTPIPIPWDCTDGFLGAYWRRPETYLDPTARRSISCFARGDTTLGLEQLAADLRSGRWHERHQDLLTRDDIDLGYRLVCAEIANP